MTFELDGTTFAAIGSLLGTLVGGITFLFRELIRSKDQQISELARQVHDAEQRAEVWQARVESWEQKDFGASRATRTSASW